VFVYHQIDVHAQLGVIDNSSPSITQDITKAVDTRNIQNPLRDGSYLAVKSPDGENEIGVIDIGKILTFGQAQNETLRLIRNIINYVL
jgi:hypothetical protein